MSKYAATAVVILLALVFLLPVSPTAAQSAPPEFMPGPCPVEFNTAGSVECGVVIVPQDRLHAEGGTVKLAVAVFRAQSETPAPDPLIFLDGGPGARTLDSLAGGLGNLMTSINRERDVIIFDYRGMGYSDPALTCPERAGAADESWIAACRAQVEAQGVDVTDFTTRDNAADAADIVRALGYETYNIWGGSYGSSVAMTLLRDRPENIRAALVTALQPPQGDLQAETPVGIMRALDGISALCQADTACAQVFPGGLTAQLAAVVARLEAAPVAAPDAAGELNSIDLLVALSELLKDDMNIPVVPGLMAALYGEQYDFALPFANAATLPPDPLFPVGAWLSMRCTDSILATTPEAMEAALQTIDPAFHDPVIAIYALQVGWCEDWGARPPTNTDRLPAVTNTPVLIISGALDPFSSAAWLASTLETLPNGHGFMLPHHMHFVIQNPCAAGLLTGFIDDPAHEPDASCLSEVVPPVFKVE
jgi:pimeloyl-ACP methyl ester carboxylesterase